MTQCARIWLPGTQKKKSCSKWKTEFFPVIFLDLLFNKMIIYNIKYTNFQLVCPPGDKARVEESPKGYIDRTARFISMFYLDCYPEMSGGFALWKISCQPVRSCILHPPCRPFSRVLHSCPDSNQTGSYRHRPGQGPAFFYNPE